MNLFALNLVAAALTVSAVAAETNAAAGLDLFRQPLSRKEALEIAARQNSGLIKARSDIDAASGQSRQLRSSALPRLRTDASFRANDRGSIESFGVDSPAQNWSANAQIVQPLYEGGRITANRAQSRLVTDQATANLSSAAADTARDVLTAYDDALLAAEQITVQESSIALLGKELEDQKRRFEAGTAPRFNVLRAEVALANAQPRLIRARNAYRIAKNNLINLLGYDLPPNVWQDIPLKFADKLTSEPVSLTVEDALTSARTKRPELRSLTLAADIRREAVKSAKSGTKPAISGFLGYGARNSSFTRDLSDEKSGWFAGAQASWDLWDGDLTKGKVAEANAALERAEETIRETDRSISLEVRTAWSNLEEAREVLESQKKVVEQAEEALRLAKARTEAGSGTQLEVLDAQTALTEARTTQIQALRDYSVARTRLDRSIGNLTLPGIQ